KQQPPKSNPSTYSRLLSHSLFLNPCFSEFTRSDIAFNFALDVPIRALLAHSIHLVSKFADSFGEAARAATRRAVIRVVVAKRSNHVPLVCRRQRHKRDGKV